MCRVKGIASRLCTQFWPIGASSATEELDTVGKYQSHFIGHPTRSVPGIEQNTGALGHGLAVAVGMALAAKLDRRSYRVFTLLGDGELDEGFQPGASSLPPITTWTT